jgi:hypothetical protein
MERQEVLGRKWSNPEVNTLALVVIRHKDAIQRQKENVKEEVTPAEKWIAGKELPPPLSLTPWGHFCDDGKYWHLHVCSLHQGSRAQHDFSLAWLEAAWYSSESGHNTTQHELVQKLWKMCTVLLYYPTTEFKSVYKVMFTDTVKDCRVILYRTVHLGVSFPEGGLLAGRE